ncbi:expressed unknown protein [Seminavis robusta]|uniref:Uncharacterized protein n=1 Tax=Seminavis robusta TaxID=568900 RepID=A0A9N8DDY3_9STRA|nr:expressed unknown protein [Seminavis robusta]|eukprot:Sro78_g042460.1 n/a (598) ;mRNA; f:72026-73819
MPMPTTFRVVCAVIGLCALLGMLFEERLVLQLKSVDVMSGSSRVAISSTGGGAGSFSFPESSKAALASSIPTSPVAFDAEKPLFVLSLVNHYDLAIPRYFECAGYNRSNMVNRWMPVSTNPKEKRRTVGQCLRDKVTSRTRITTSSCGNNNHVWLNTQFLQAPRLNPKRFRAHDCFDLVMSPGALTHLAENAYPQGGTILNVIRDPMEWVQTLSPQLPKHWHEWCNDNHNNAFPGLGEVNNKRSLLGFYLEYQNRIKEFVANNNNQNWNYVEIDLRHSHQEIGAQLQQQLGIDKQCWVDSAVGNFGTEEDDPLILANQPRPNDITYPALVTAMPKSGTSTINDYFGCGLGEWTASHQWTWMTHDSPKGVKEITIGECMVANSENNTDILKGCGNAMVWSDTGVLRHANRKMKTKGICYLPMLHMQGLERFYNAYPRGTIIHMVRETSSWISSVKRWNNLHLRWVKGKCMGAGFPKHVDAPDREWEQFYEGVTEIVRSFVKSHPSLTYIELPLSENAAPMVHDIFRFPKSCWGHSNVNNPDNKAVSQPPKAKNATSPVKDVNTGVKNEKLPPLALAKNATGNTPRMQGFAPKTPARRS